MTTNIPLDVTEANGVRLLLGLYTAFREEFPTPGVTLIVDKVDNGIVLFQTGQEIVDLDEVAIQGIIDDGEINPAGLNNVATLIAKHLCKPLANRAAQTWKNGQPTSNPVDWAT